MDSELPGTSGNHGSSMWLLASALPTQIRFGMALLSLFYAVSLLYSVRSGPLGYSVGSQSGDPALKAGVPGSGPAGGSGLQVSEFRRCDLSFNCLITRSGEIL